MLENGMLFSRYGEDDYWIDYSEIKACTCSQCLCDIMACEDVYVNDAGDIYCEECYKEFIDEFTTELDRLDAQAEFTKREAINYLD